MMWCLRSMLLCVFVLFCVGCASAPAPDEKAGLDGAGVESPSQDTSLGVDSGGDLREAVSADAGGEGVSTKDSRPQEEGPVKEEVSETPAGGCVWKLSKSISAHVGYVRVVAFRGDKLLSGASDKTVSVWDWKTGQMKMTFTAARAIDALVIAPDGQTVATGGSDKQIQLWSMTTGKVRQVIKGHIDAIKSLAYSPDGKWLASGDAGATVRLWDASTGAPAGVLSHSALSFAMVEGLSFSPDSKTLASGAWDRNIRLWDLATKKKRLELKGHKGYVLSLAFNSDGKWLASSSWAAGSPLSSDIRLWDPSSGKEVRVLKGHTGNIRTIAFSPDDKLLASGANTTNNTDNTLRLWDPTTGQELQKMEMKGGVNSVAFNAAGDVMAVGISQNKDNLLLYRCQ